MSPSSMPHRPVDVRGQILGLVAEELQRVDRRIGEALAAESASVARLMEHVAQFGGKRLRPAVVALIARALGRFTEEHVTVGAAVELVHLASLVHDDVLDGATTRRKVPTVHSVHGTHAAILLGDMIYARAFTLVSELDDRQASRWLAETSSDLCCGEIEQNLARGRLDLPLEEYLHIIEQKTASLYAAACYLAARYAGAGEADAQRLHEYGNRLGVAFQVIDDCLDLAGEEERVGKSLGTDLERCKLTLPLMHLRDRLSDGELQEFERLLVEPDVPDRRKRLFERFDLGPDLEHARNYALRQVERAISCLDPLRPCPETEALRRLGALVLDRDH